jgi:hypothetical protein
MLKRDAELLNHIIVTDEDGNLYSRKELIPLIKKKYSDHIDFNSSDEDDDEHPQDCE